MTMKWSFSYNSFVKLIVYNYFVKLTLYIIPQSIPYYGPQNIVL